MAVRQLQQELLSVPVGPLATVRWRWRRQLLHPNLLQLACLSCRIRWLDLLLQTLTVWKLG
jgi:hypothetical protein